MLRTGCRRDDTIIVLFAAAIYVIGVLSPPGLMDDVDAVQGQIAHNMLQSGDWVTARLDGVPYLEKAPLPYWLMAIAFQIFGVHDWSARLPFAASAILLALVTAKFSRWAMGREAGFYAGLSLATCTGLFLFTRVLIPDVALTLAITVALFSLMRALNAEEATPGMWAFLFWIAVALGMLLKGLIALVFPVLTAGIFLATTGDISNVQTWRRLRPATGFLIFLVIAVPWHILATLANPPYFDLTMHSEPRAYHGFFWFYFLNEHLFRFLNIRYPRDYNTVPRGLFWVLNLVWLFPWSVYLPAAVKLKFGREDRASRTRLLALCWLGVVLVFFTLSTTQEYYSMPSYPAMAMLAGSAMTCGGAWINWGTRIAAIMASVLCGILVFLLVATRGLPTPGDVSVRLAQNPDLYSFSMGHLFDLRFGAFAYFRVPLALAAVATFIGATTSWLGHGRRAYLGLAVMMVLLCNAARLALIKLDPHLGSKALAEALLKSSPGKLIFDGPYYGFSSIVFYTNRPVLLLNGRKENLEYGSHAPGAPPVFINDADFSRYWTSHERYYVAATLDALPRLRNLAGKDGWFIIAEEGRKCLATNQPIARTN